MKSKIVAASAETPRSRAILGAGRAQDRKRGAASAGPLVYERQPGATLFRERTNCGRVAPVEYDRDVIDVCRAAGTPQLAAALIADGATWLDAMMKIRSVN